MAPKKKTSSTQPSSGKDKTLKSNREKMAQRRSEAQTFKNLKKTDYLTVKYWGKKPYKDAPGLQSEGLSPREVRERKRKAQRATEYLEKKYPTFTKKVNEGKVSTPAFVDATWAKGKSGSMYPAVLGSSKAKSQARAKGITKPKAEATKVPKGAQPKTKQAQEKATKSRERAYRESKKYGR